MDMGIHRQPSASQIAIPSGILRAVHSLCTSLGERDSDSLLVRAADLSLDLLAGAAAGVPADRKGPCIGRSRTPMPPRTIAHRGRC